MGSLRAAAGPADIRGDLRALPSVILRSKAGWVPAALIAGTTLAMLVPSLASNALVAMASNVVLQPPPMIIAFLAGMLAPRAGWLMGGLQTLLASGEVLRVDLGVAVPNRYLGFAGIIHSNPICSFFRGMYRDTRSIHFNCCIAIAQNTVGYGSTEHFKLVVSVFEFGESNLSIPAHPNRVSGVQLHLGSRFGRS
jgi:hypothetical protein